MAAMKTEVYCLGGLDIEVQHTGTGNFVQYKGNHKEIPFQGSPGSFLAVFRNVEHIYFCASKEIFM